MSDNAAAQSIPPEQKEWRQLRSHPTPYNLRCFSTSIPQLRPKAHWTRPSMDPLLQNDTSGTRVELDKKDSIVFLKFVYPDHRVFPTVKSSGALDSNVDPMMDSILEGFRKRKWYGRPQNRTTNRWLPLSGCPSLGPKSIKNREVHLENFFNNILGVVSEACNLSFFRWDASSSELPLDGSPSRRKPDITCCFGPPSASNHHWGEVATFCEVKNRNNGTKKGQSFTEISGKTSCILGAQDGRHFVPCIRMLGSSICLTAFDHGGSITTYAFDINSSPKQFLRILIGVSLADYSSLGFDISIEWDGKGGTLVDEAGSQTQDDEGTDEAGSQDNDEMDEMSQDADGSDSETVGSDEEDSQLEDYDDIDTSDDSDDNVSDVFPSTGSNGGIRQKWLRVVDKDGRVCKIWLRKILSISDRLIGRGSTVWEGVVDLDTLGPDIPVAIKDSWIDPLRKYTEGMILHILAQYSIEGVPELFAEGQVSTRHFFDETEVNMSTHFIRSKLRNVRSPDNFHLRVLSRLVTLPVGTLIIDFSSLGELLVALLDCVIAHKNAVDRARILHRDISLANLLLTLTRKKRRAHEKYLAMYLSGQARLKLEKRIDTLSRRGLLADWGYAVPLHPLETAHTPDVSHSDDSSVPPASPIEVPASDSPTESWDEVPSPTDLVRVRQTGKGHDVTTLSASQLTDKHDIVLLMGTDDPKADTRHTIDLCPLYRTGTWSWMSAELVMAGPGQPVVHNALHDLESFFYVLVGICVLYSEPSRQKTDEELAECYDELFNTFKPSILKTLTIQSDLTWYPKVVKHISPYFRPIIPLLDNLRNEIIVPMFVDRNEKFYRRTSFDHNTVIRHIVLSLSSLEPTAWGASASNDDWQTLKSFSTQRDPSPTPIQDSTGKQQRSMLAPPPLLSMERPFTRLSFSDSGVYLGSNANKSQSRSQRVSNLPHSPTLRKRAEKFNTSMRIPVPPPLTPLHGSLLASDRHISWSDSRLSSLRSRSRDPDEYVPYGQQKRGRITSTQGPSNDRAPDNVGTLRRSSRRKAVSNS